MAVKSNFNLDKRINSINDIQTILRYDVNCIGCKGHFFDDFWQAKDLNNRRYGKLVDIVIENNSDLCFKAELESGFTNYFRFFIPESDLKPVEKKYRPYTLAEWIDQHEIGEVIKFKNSHNQEFNVMYTGFIVDHGKDIQDIRTKGQIMFVSTPYTLQELFEHYEIYVDGEWKKFGVLDKEKE